MEYAHLLAQLQSSTVLAFVLSFGLGAAGTAIGFGLLGGKLSEGTARLLELGGLLMGRMFLVAGLLDAVAMIGIGFALYFTFASPFIGAGKAAAGQ